MITAAYFGAALLAIVVLYFALAPLVRAYLKYRGARVVTCPENSEPAGVEVDAVKAALAKGLQLRECSRWPEKQGCGQECLRQIEASPEDCLVRNMLTRWYQGKSCVLCGKSLDHIDWVEHRPALMTPERKTREWRELAPEEVPPALADCAPVCWNCHIASTFRREHPELVTERPWTKH